MSEVKFSSWLRSERWCRNLPRHWSWYKPALSCSSGAFRNCRPVWNWWSGTMSCDRSLVFRCRPTMSCAISKICQHSIQRRASRWWSDLVSSLPNPQTSRPPLQLYTKQQHLHLVPKLWRSSGHGIKRNGQWPHHLLTFCVIFHHILSSNVTCIILYYLASFLPCKLFKSNQWI